MVIWGNLIDVWENSTRDAAWRGEDSREVGLSLRWSTALLCVSR